MSCLPWNSSWYTDVTCAWKEDEKREVDGEELFSSLLLSYIPEVFMSLCWGLKSCKPCSCLPTAKYIQKNASIITEKLKTGLIMFIVLWGPIIWDSFGNDFRFVFIQLKVLGHPALYFWQILRNKICPLHWVFNVTNVCASHMMIVNFVRFGPLLTCLHLIFDLINGHAYGDISATPGAVACHV